MILSIEIERGADGDQVLCLAGELDMDGADGLIDAVRRLLDDGAGELTLDIRGLEFADSAGLRAILESHRLCVEAGCAFALTRTTTAVQRLFEIAHLEDVLPFRDDGAGSSATSGSGAGG